MPDNTQILIDAKTGQATQDVSKFKGDADGVIDHLNGREVVMRANTSEAINAAQNAVNQIAGMSATVKLKADASALLSTAQSAVRQLLK